MTTPEPDKDRKIIVEPTEEHHVHSLNQIGLLLAQYRANFLRKPQEYTSGDLRIAVEAAKKATWGDESTRTK